MLSTNKFIKRSKKIHGDKYNYSLVDYKNSKTKVKIICLKHGEFEQTPNKHLIGQGCPKCGGKLKLTIEEFINRTNKVHGDKYDYSLFDYKNMKTKVKIICRIHGIFEQNAINHIFLKQNCPKCSKLTNEYFINKSNEIHNNRYDYSFINYDNMRTKVKIICKKHGVFEQYPYAHLNKRQGCMICHKTNMFDNTTDFILKSIKIHKDRYDYSLIKYINSKTKVKIICKEHGIFEQTPNDHINGSGCPSCNISKGEERINNFLLENSINYIKQYKFKDCKYKNPLLFDFYLPKLNTCIEYDGLQHFEPIEFFGGDTSFKLQKIKDNIKNEYCEKNDIRLLRIRYNEIIEEKLNFLQKLQYQ